MNGGRHQQQPFMLPDLEASLSRLMPSPADDAWLAAQAASVLDHYPPRPFDRHAFANQFTVSQALLQWQTSVGWRYEPSSLGKKDLDFARALPYDFAVVIFTHLLDRGAGQY